MARIDKADAYVICGAIRGNGACGGRVGMVMAEKDKRVLAILPGWDRGTDGVWHEPPNDFVRRQRGHAARRLPPRVTGTHNSAQSYHTPLFPLDGSPIRIRCSDCQSVHEVRRTDFGFAQGSDGSMTTTPNP